MRNQQVEVPRGGWKEETTQSLGGVENAILTSGQNQGSRSALHPESHRVSFEGPDPHPELVLPGHQASRDLHPEFRGDSAYDSPPYPGEGHGVLRGIGAEVGSPDEDGVPASKWAIAGLKEGGDQDGECREISRLRLRALEPSADLIAAEARAQGEAGL
jgi:hypothetical protein